jgi:hypothetical protein
VTGEPPASHRPSVRAAAVAGLVGVRSRSGACSGGPVGCSPRSVSSSGVCWMGERQSQIRGSAGGVRCAGSGRAVAALANSIRPRPSKAMKQPRIIARGHDPSIGGNRSRDPGLRFLGGELGRGGPTRTDGLIPKFSSGVGRPSS